MYRVQVVALHVVLGEALPVGRPHLVQHGVHNHVFSVPGFQIWLEALEPGSQRLRLAIQIDIEEAVPDLGLEFR